ncbi:hypothetical protein EJD97_005989, partial [Solanum chilense]
MGFVALFGALLKYLVRRPSELYQQRTRRCSGAPACLYSICCESECLQGERKSRDIKIQEKRLWNFGLRVLRVFGLGLRFFLGFRVCVL